MFTVKLNVDQTINDLKQFARTKGKRAGDAVTAVSLVMEAILKKNIGLKDSHSLRVLRKMGHPYGWGSRTHKPLHNPNEQVHIQSGKLFGAIDRVVSKQGNSIVASIGIKDSQAELAKWIISGTDLMIPRDFMALTQRDITASIAFIQDLIVRELQRR